MALKTEREAMFYDKLEQDIVRCRLCPHFCTLKVGESGKCRSRTNVSGKLMAINYGQSIGIGVDPIEKKPLYHFRPGTQILSLGANSCNLACFFCQNYESSQYQVQTRFISPEALHDLVHEQQDGIYQVAFTYTEPFTWYEYISDFAGIAADTDIVLVTNGFINPEPLQKLMPKIKAMNIDLKSIKAEFYQKHCQAYLADVLRTIQSVYEYGIHLEITNLLIPGLNDTDAEIRALPEFIASIDKNIPLHISAYHPAFQSNIPATEVTAVLRACDLACEVLSYVYAGNVQTGLYHETKCPNCGTMVISARRKITHLSKTGKCLQCDQMIYGVF